MKQIVAKNFVYNPLIHHPVSFSNEEGSVMQIRFVTDKVVQVLFFPSRDCGNLLLSLPASTTLDITHNSLQHIVKVQTQTLCVAVDYAEGLSLTWTAATVSVDFAQDLKYRAYSSDGIGGGVFHYMRRDSTEVYCGLGERTGNLDLHGRRFRLEGYDAMGYNAETTDPLYKHCPFYLTLSKKTGIAYGLFYNNMSRTVIDLGAEIDALWGPYRYYYAESGPLEYYLFYGPSVETAFDGFASLMGSPKSLPPRYSLGYLASAMGYAEADNAQELLEDFPKLCRQHNIPCDGLHLSSGYTVAPSKERCVFTWNLNRFPNAKRLMVKLKEHGIHVFANIKPWLLKSHPQYETIKELRGFIWDSDSNQPATVMQWSAGAGTCSSASYIDFTSQAGYDFWKQSVKATLLDYGISGCWNDNNEFTMTDDTNTFAMEVMPPIAPLLRKCSSQSRISATRVGGPFQTLMMAQCSYEALYEQYPSVRPFVITRSASPWCHLFAAQTWSGDNHTDWKTLKFNIPMGLSAGLSALPGGYGHDVGGFSGPKPSPELFVRWVHNGILNPRFCIHSWNSDSTITEPWMYPSVLPIIRRSIQFRMRLVPLLYALLVEFKRTVRPLLRPVFWHFQHDPNTYEQCFEYMLGGTMLVAPVYADGVRTRTVYLPEHRAGWFHFQTGDYFSGGMEVTVEAPLEDTFSPVFIPGGGMIPLGKIMQHVGEVPDDERIVLLFPPPINSVFSRTETFLIDDDGTSSNYALGEYAELKLWMETREAQSTLTLGLETVHAGYKPEYDVLWLVVVTKEERLIDVHGVEELIYKTDEIGRQMVGIPIRLKND